MSDRSPLPTLKSWCKYSNILGLPGKGFHTHLISVPGWGREVDVGFAYLDFVGTIGLAFIVSKVLKTGFVPTFVVMMLFVVTIHWVMCVPTALNKLLRVAS